MKEHPILFSAPMIRALLAGTKTQTRRIIKPQPTRVIDHMDGRIRIPDGWQWKDLYECDDSPFGFARSLAAKSPYGQAGDQLWVREAFAYSVKDPDALNEERTPETHDIVCRASLDGEGEWTNYDENGKQSPTKPTWKPGIHMPRWASRISLEVTGVRVERLHAITEDDARAEGVERFLDRYPVFAHDQQIDGDRVDEKPYRTSYVCLWDEINGDRALFSSNPWVWVVDFKRVDAKQEVA